MSERPWREGSGNRGGLWTSLRSTEQKQQGLLIPLLRSSIYSALSRFLVINQSFPDMLFLLSTNEIPKPRLKRKVLTVSKRLREILAGVVG